MTRPRRIAIELAAATAALFAPTLINGYPLVYPDTGAYLRQAIELQGASGRPPYYSLLIFPMHLTISLWPVSVIQCLILAIGVRLAVSATAPRANGLYYLSITLALAIFTSAPWHAGQIMPDIYTGLLMIGVFLIAWKWDSLGRAARAALVLSVCGMTTLHYTHLPLVAGLFGVAAIVRLTQQAGWAEGRRIALIGALAAGSGGAAFLAYSLALVHRPVLSPDGDIYLAARLLADGPGRDWLATTCPGSGNGFCKYRERIPDSSGVFLWHPDSPLADVLREEGREEARRSAAQIVAGTIRMYPAATLAHALANSGRQLVRFASLDTECPEHCGDDEAVSKVIKAHFPREYDQFRHSLQMTGRLPVARVRAVHYVAVLVASIGALVGLALAISRRDHLIAGFVLLVLATLLFNAIITGALSGAYDRYQSRVIWLIPLCALLTAGRRRSSQQGLRAL